MQRYRCHKVVQAAKILRRERISEGIWNLVLEPTPPVESLGVTVDLGYMKRHAPQVGGYYVKYEDGYESFSPAAAFESGYTLITD